MALNTGTRYTYDAAADAKTQAALAAIKRPSSTFTTGGIYGDNRSSKPAWEQQWAAYDAARTAAQGTALNPQKQAEQQIMDATFGQGDAAMSDPRIEAALNALDPAKAQSSAYAQMTDANAAQAGALADMQREQFAQAGVGMGDPAAQARMRQVETARMQGNNAALGQSQQAGQGVAAQMAQTRLAQMGMANQMYSQGAGMLAQKQFNQSFTPAGFSTSVPTYPAQKPATQPQTQDPPWTPPNTQPADAVAAQGNTRVQTPAATKAPGQSAQQAQAKRLATGTYAPPDKPVNNANLLKALNGAGSKYPMAPNYTGRQVGTKPPNPYQWATPIPG